ncbi:MAG: epoxyqueuosine reductase [Ruminococcaceae bacterium]|nr:epoxyqueuosine reductase [Oscillospiraceae bacterium]
MPPAEDAKWSLMNTFTQNELLEFLGGEGIDIFCICRPEDLLVLDQSKYQRMQSAFNKAPGAVLIFLAPYFVGEEEANISLYAVSKDYHLYFKELSGRFSDVFGLGEGDFALFGDNSPIDEVDAATAFGLGVRGDNGLVINEKYGSYVFIGEIFLSFVPEGTVFSKRGEKRECLHCKSCVKACPESALVKGDMSNCLSAISQKRRISDREAELLKKHCVIWGCDLCQKKCPMNKNANITPIRFFYEDRIPQITREVIDKLVLEEKFSQRAFSWRGKDVILRNLNLTFQGFMW